MNTAPTIARPAVEAAAAQKIQTAQLRVVSRPQLRFWSDTLRRRFEPDWSVSTACTDGFIVKYNPAFVDGLSLPEVVFLIAHEVAHVKMGHHLRRGKRDPRLYNMAADYIINDMLQSTGLDNFQVIDGCLLDNNYRWNTTSEDAVYDILAADQANQPDQPGQPGQPGQNGQNGQEKPQNGQNGQEKPQDAPGGQNGPGKAPVQGQGQSSSTGQARPFAGDIVQVTEPAGFADLPEADQAAALADHAAQVRKDNTAAQMAGNAPGVFKDYFDKLDRPEKPWRTILADFCLSRSQAGYDWLRADSRFHHKGIFLPARGRQRIGHVIIAVDTSGSLNHTKLQHFISEVNDIVTATNVEQITVLYCDTRIHQVDEYMDGDQIELNVNGGGGGTSFRPPFEYAEQEALDPDVFIYFTDGYCCQFAEEPDYPVLWVVDSTYKFSPPYGEVTYMEKG